MSNHSPAVELRKISSESEVTQCYSLMKELRPHLASADDFVQRWRQQAQNGYQLSALWIERTISVLAGYRVQENLVHGRHLYVDDLVTSEAMRSRGYGEQMIEYLIAEGRRLNCAKLLLDTPLANVLGHRFYYRQGMLATALRFTLPLPQNTSSAD